MKNKKLETYFERMKELSDLKSIDNSNKFSSNTLVEHTKAVDGTILGIVKDAHHYFIKKSISKDSVLNESHFTFINGVENKLDYRYNTLADAQKHLNFHLGSIAENFSTNKKIQQLNETVSTVEKVEKPFDFLRNVINEGKRLNKIEDYNRFKNGMGTTSDKALLTEDEVEKAIDNTEDKLEKLDVELEKKAEVPEKIKTPTPEIEDEKVKDEEDEVEDIEDVDVDKLEIDNESNDEDELNVDELEVDDESKEDEESKEDKSDDGDLEIKEIEKMVGKLTYKVRNQDLTPEQTKSFMNSLISAFKKELEDVDLEDKKEMSNEILKDEESSESVDENAECVECKESKPFKQYISERGYDELNDVSAMEMASVIGDYIDDNEELSDDVLSEIAEYCDENVINELSECGYVNETEKLQPFVKKVNENGTKKFGVVDVDFTPEEVNENDDEFDTQVDDLENAVNNVDFAPPAQTLGVSTPKTAELNINVKTGDATLTISEQKEEKIREYIRKRIDEKFSGKTIINENKKSNKLKKLDYLIDKTLLNLTK